MFDLTIAIPVYKRPEFLDLCLNSIYKQTDRVNLCVCIFDDSESCINVNVIEKYKGLGLSIYHHRNLVNLGIDLNVQHLINTVESGYFMMLGEDDILLPGSLGYVLDLCRGPKFNICALNYAYINDKQTSISGYAYNSLTGREIHSTKEFIAKHLYKLGFCGSFVVNAKILLRKDYEVYLGTYFTHLGRLIDIMPQQESIMLLNVPIAGNRAHGDSTFTWREDSYGVFFGFERLCKLAADRNPQFNYALREAIDSYRAANGHLKAKSIIRLKANGLYSYDQYKRHLQSSTELPYGFRFVFILFALMPISVAKIIVFVHSILLTRQKKLHAR